MLILYSPFMFALAGTVISELIIAAGLAVLPKLGPAGNRLAAASCRAPLLDFWVAAFTWIPWAAALFWGWRSLLGALLGQAIALVVWSTVHGLMQRRGSGREPRIATFLNRQVGTWQNHIALWYTLIALPGFWFIRILQLVAYWPLVLLLGFPRYRQAEWVNVSRQKFAGLVGYDLIWCLYCDWMT